MLNLPPTTPTRWTERFPIARLPLTGELALAIAATAFATAARWLIADVLPPGFPYLTYLPMVIVGAFLFGSRAGSFIAVLSGVAAWYWFIPPDGFGLNEGTLVALLFYAFITGTHLGLVHWTQRSNRLLIVERESNARLARTRELLFRELQHRVSNNLQMVAGLLTIQRRQLKDEGARTALDEAVRRLGVVGRISRQLYDPAGSNQPLHGLLDQLARDVIETSSTATIQHSVTGAARVSIAPEAAIPLALVVAETIANAIEHGFDGQDDCQLAIRLAELSDGRLSVEIEDNGRGLPDGFSLGESDSLGLKIATMLAKQLGGEFSLVPGSPRGTLARLELPLAPV
jgi:two-component sensor histidine kinase